MTDDINQTPPVQPPTPPPAQPPVPPTPPPVPTPAPEPTPPVIAPPSQPDPQPENTSAKPPMPIQALVLLLVIAASLTGLIINKYASTQNNANNTKASGRVTQSDLLNKYKIKISPTGTLSATPTLTPTPTGYQNVFDSNTQTTNPFNDNVNPFDNLQ